MGSCLSLETVSQNRKKAQLYEIKNKREERKKNVEILKCLVEE